MKPLNMLWCTGLILHQMVGGRIKRRPNKGLGHMMVQWLRFCKDYRLCSLRIGLLSAESSMCKCCLLVAPPSLLHLPRHLPATPINIKSLPTSSVALTHPSIPCQSCFWCAAWASTYETCWLTLQECAVLIRLIHPHPPIPLVIHVPHDTCTYVHTSLCPVISTNVAFTTWSCRRQAVHSRHQKNHIKKGTGMFLRGLDTTSPPLFSLLNSSAIVGCAMLKSCLS